jgi:hypothetical protein
MVVLMKAVTALATSSGSNRERCLADMLTVSSGSHRHDELDTTVVDATGQ